MEDRRITVRPVKNDIASCCICGAKNYESRLFRNTGRYEKNIMEIDFGNANGAIIVRVCPDCLKSLIDEGNGALESLRK